MVMRRIKGLLYENAEPATPAASNAAQPAASPAASMTMPGTVPGAVHAPEIAAMVAAIKKATFGRNTAFTQLLSASDVLIDVVPDPTMRLRAAHKTAGAGRTGKQIADAVDIHLQDVDGEVMRFKAALEAKISTEVRAIEAQGQTAQAQLDSAQAEIEAARRRIDELTNAVGQLMQAVSQAQAQAAQRRAELDQSMVQFQAAAQEVRAELQNNKTAILSTLV